ncbi:unnamed protein product, partial [Rotaria socialis]
MYPQLSLAVEIFLCAPISTATVEQHLEQIMRISIEGPSDLDDDLKDLIINCWK